MCPFVSGSGSLKWGSYSKQEDEKGKKKREQVDPQDPFIGLCQISMPMSTSAFIAWATSLCDSKILGTSSGYLYVAC